MMVYNVLAILPNGATVFNGNMGFVPRKGEEIEANGRVYVVDSVRYVFVQGSHSGQFVRLVLKHVF